MTDRMTELVLYCDHDCSWTGAEGPIRDLGRWPILWTCDGCDWLILQDPADA